ncbi:hypothetical protein HDU96_003296 [Phlyctochytrium bullatum]|nr:hypothetical protein HDU96_003296 [Phlyctochytrium bullatum]
MSSSTQDDCAALKEAFPALVPSGSGDCCINSTTGAFDLSSRRNSGITCRQGRIIAIDLSSRTLRTTPPLPSLAPSLATLDQLEMLRIYNSSLTGTIPAYLGSLLNLRFLDLTIGSLSGSIPRELGNLPKLEHMDFSNNNLSSTVPAELANLTELRNLFLWRNAMYGNISPALVNLPQLAVPPPCPLPHTNSTAALKSDLRFNYFTGVLPIAVSRLRRRRIEDNCFTIVENATAYENTGMKQLSACESFYAAKGLTLTSFNISIASDRDTTSPPSPTPLPIAPIAGGAAAAALVLLIASILFVTFLRRRRQKPTLPPLPTYTSSTPTGLSPSPAPTTPAPTAYTKPKPAIDPTTGISSPHWTTFVTPIPSEKSSSALFTGSTTTRSAGFSTVMTRSDTATSSGAGDSKLGGAVGDVKRGEAVESEVKLMPVEPLQGPSPSPSPAARARIKALTPTEVGEALMGMGVGPGLAAALEDHGIDGVRLLQLTDAELVGMGISDRFQRELVVRSAGNLVAREVEKMEAEGTGMGAEGEGTRREVLELPEYSEEAAAEGEERGV